jgi:hypothetical protein
MNQEDDAIEICDLLHEQGELLWHVYHVVTEPPRKIDQNVDLALFILTHAAHIHQLSSSALILMQNRKSYSVVFIARPALESLFTMVASVQDRSFGPQRIAFELEELARKIKGLLEYGVWTASRHPTPEECLREAARIRRECSAPTLGQKVERDRIEKIERIAQVAGLSPFYDDDYRQLSLAVHSNQAGILNAASGFLVRKAMLALCHTTHRATHVLCRAFQAKEYLPTLQEYEKRLETVTLRPEFLEGMERPPGFSAVFPGKPNETGSS